MRVCVTDRRDPSPADLRPAGELAPSLALPWIVKLRYGMVLGQILLALLIQSVFDVPLPIAWLTIPLALTVTSHLLLRRSVERLGVRRALGSLLALDTLCLTALLALTGGPANPFSLLYLVQITLSAVVLSKQWTWGLGALSVAGFGFLFWAHVRVPILEAHHPAEGFSVHLTGMWIAFAAAALLVTVFIGKVSESLRKREQEVLLLQDQLARHERLASVVTLAAGAAHELGTPLSTIAVASRDLELHAADVTQEARLIRSEVERCRRILQQMSARGAEPPGEAPADLQLDEFLERVRRGFPSAAQERVRTAVTGGERTVALPAEATLQALTVLVKNALEAGGGQPVSLSAELAAGKVRFTVADSGCGMSQETLSRIAEPFFTTKEPGRGMGLGTFLTRAVAVRLGGSLSFESETGKGTQAVLELPLICHDEQREASSARHR